MSAVSMQEASARDANKDAPALPSRTEIEDFLFHEASLLDDWKVAEWANLFTDDGEYMVPPTDDPHADPKTTLFLVYDDRHRLAERGKRLLSKAAHAEFPHSRTVHLYSNVRIEAYEQPSPGRLQDACSPPRDAGAVLGEWGTTARGGEVVARCGFIVSRSKGPVSETYPGHMLFRLVRIGDQWRIRLKRAELALEVLRPHGKISIIL